MAADRLRDLAVPARDGRVVSPGTDAARAAAQPQDPQGELGVPAKLQDDRMGHEDGSVQARYSPITVAMRPGLLDGLTGLWESALGARRAMSSRSPVVVLDGCSPDARGRSGSELSRSTPQVLPIGGRKQFRAGLPCAEDQP